MKHFTKLLIVNFKSHEETVIDLNEGINTVYGDPQAGKSNVFRALELLMNNRPRGGGFLPNFLTKCETHVALTDSDGLTVGIKCHVHKTKKGKKKRDSTYYYIEDTKNEKFWDATGVGSDVPAEITKALNLTDINLQFQKDPPFLATKSGSQISKTVNKITGLDEGDRLSSTLSTKVNAQNAVVKATKEELAGFETQKKIFPNISDLKKTIKRVKALELQISKTESNMNNLEGSARNCNTLKREVAEFAIPDGIPNLISQIKSIDGHIHDNKVTSNAIHAKVATIKDLKFDVSMLEGQDPGDYTLQIAFVRKYLKYIEKGEQTIKDCERALFLKRQQGFARHELDTAIEEYVVLMKKAATCPWCFQTINEKTLKSIERRIRGKIHGE